MTIYLAGSSKEPIRAAALAEDIARQGINVLCPWVNWTPETHPNEEELWFNCCACIDKASAFLGLVSLGRTHAGLTFEAGYAIAKGKPVYLLGPQVASLVSLGHWIEHRMVSQYSNQDQLIRDLLWLRDL
jgi:nucleoside 2-deoxyribosyltransferase